MKYAIDTKILEKEELSLSEFGVLLYFIGKANLNAFPIICNTLWNKGYLVKEDNNFSLSTFKVERLQNIISESSNSTDTNNKAETLATKLRMLFPAGYKESLIGGVVRKYSWRDSDRIISQRLKTFFRRYGNKWSDEEIISATRRYVEDNKNDTTFMKILKYFIFKDKGRQDGEGKGYIDESSDLLTYLENNDTGSTSNDIGELL